MGREVKRVPLDFDYPLHKVWYGYQIVFCHEDYEGGCERCQEFARVMGIPPKAYKHIQDDSPCPDWKKYFKVDPPEGEGWQLWGTTTEGEPRSPVFKTPEELADWCKENDTVFADINLLACREHMELLGQLQESGAWVDFTQGLDARLLTIENIRAINTIKVKEIHFAWDFFNFAENNGVLRGLWRYLEHGKKNRHGQYATVYVLTNYNTTMDENLFRIYTLRELGFDPYVMIYDKPNAPREIRLLQRWCNNRLIFRAEPDFYKYDPKRG